MKSLWNRTALVLLSVLALQIAAPIAPAAFAMDLQAEIGDQNPFSNPWAQDPDWVRNHVYQQVERHGYTPAVQQFIQNMQQVAQSPVTSSNPQEVKNFENLREQVSKDSVLLQNQLQQFSLPQPPQYLHDFKEQDLDAVTQSLWKSVGWDDSSTPPSDGLTRQTANVLDGPQGLTKIYEAQSRYLEMGREDISDLIGSTINEKFVDINGLAKGLKYGIPFQGYLRSKITTQQGRDIREGLNTVLVADHVIQKSCQSDASNAALCNSYRQLSLELAAGYLVADRISGRQDQAPYQSLMESLARGTKLVGSFAKEVATGALKLGAGAAALALLPEELAAGAVALTVTAIAHEIGKALLDYPATSDAIKNFVRDSKDTLLHGSAEEQGALLGKATVAVGGVLFGRQIGAAADATAVAARGIIADGVTEAVSYEVVAESAHEAVLAGKLSTERGESVTELARDFPNETAQIVREHPAETLDSNFPQLTPQSVSGAKKLALLADDEIREGLLVRASETLSEAEIAAIEIQIGDPLSSPSLRSARGTLLDVQRDYPAVTRHDFGDLSNKAANMDVSALGKEAAFWSGGDEARAAALAWVEEDPANRIMLERTPGGKYFDELQLYRNEPITRITDDQGKALFIEISKRYAQSAEGEVRLFINDIGFIKPNSVFKGQEIIELIKNPKVNSIKVIPIHP